MANEIKIKLTIDGKDATATLDLSDSKIQKMISSSRQAKVQTDDLTKSFERMASVLLGFFAVSKINDFLKDSIKQFGEEERTIALLHNTVGSATKGLVEYADRMARLTGIADDEIMAAEKQIGDFVKDEEMIKKLTKATMDFATAKGMDLVSASNLVARTLAGESKSLGRIKLDIDENAKGMERYNQIADAMTKIWGGQAETAGSTFTGTLGKMRNAVDNLKEAIGERLAGVFTVIADKIGFMSDKARESSKALMTVEVIARTLGIVIGGVSQIVVTLGTVLGGLFGMIGRIAYELPSIIEGLARAVKGDPMGSLLASSSVDRISDSFKEWMKSISGVQKAYAGFYNMMLNPQTGSSLPLPGGIGKETPSTATDHKKELRELIKAAEEQWKIDKQLYDLKAKNIEEYYDLVKFKDEGYFEWKSAQYVRDYLSSLNAGTDKVIAEATYNEKIKKLIDDLDTYRRDSVTGVSLKGKTPAQIKAEIEDTYYRSPRDNPLFEDPIQKEKELHNDLMNTASQFGDAMARALDRGGKHLVSYVNIALQAAIKISDIISKMNSGDKSEASGIMGIIASLLPFLPFLILDNGGVINEPVFGFGAKSGRSYAFAKDGAPEVVLPMNRFSQSHYQNSTPQRMEIELTGSVGVTQKGMDLYGAITKRNIIIKKYY